MSDFKKFVLDVAREQISENTDIELDFELKKGEVFPLDYSSY
ncbi:hypothetical protein [Riemerella anatipestifer]